MRDDASCSQGSAGSSSRPRYVGGAKALAFLEFLEERQVETQAILATLADADASVFQQGLRCEHEVPEQSLFSLMRATAEHQGLPGGVEQLAFDYGSFLLLWMAERAGYREALYQVSSTFLGFARSLNQVLVQLLSSLGHPRTGLREAHISEITSDSFVLGFFESSGEGGSSDGGQDDGGLGRNIRMSTIMGMLDRAAADIYGLQVEFERLDTGGCPSRQHQAVRVHFAPHSGDLRNAAEEAAQAEGSIMGLDPKSFYRLFPFHFVMSMDFAVLQVGSALQRMLPQLSKPGARVNDVLTIHQPTVPWDLQCIQAILHDDLNSKLVLTSACGVELEGALVKIHRMRHCPDLEGCLRAGEQVLVFLGNPHMNSLHDMKAHGVFLSDFAPQETAGEHILASVPRHAKANEALREAERSNAALKETLACTLANQEAEDGRPKLNIDSAANMILRLLDSLIMGGDVSVTDVLTVRDALLRGGTNLWRPLDFDVRVLDADQEVNEALSKLLGANNSTSNADKAQQQQQQQQQGGGGAPTTSGNEGASTFGAAFGNGGGGMAHSAALAALLAGGTGGSASPTASRWLHPISRSKSVSLAVYKRSGTERSSTMSTSQYNGQYSSSRPLTHAAISRGSQELTYCDSYLGRAITPRESGLLGTASLAGACTSNNGGLAWPGSPSGTASALQQRRGVTMAGYGYGAERPSGQDEGAAAALRAGLGAAVRSLTAGHRASDDEILALHRHLIGGGLGGGGDAGGEAPDVGAAWGTPGASDGAGTSAPLRKPSWLQSKLGTVFGCFRPSAHEHMHPTAHPGLVPGGDSPSPRPRVGGGGLGAGRLPSTNLGSAGGLGGLLHPNLGGHGSGGPPSPHTNDSGGLSPHLGGGGGRLNPHLGGGSGGGGGSPRVAPADGCSGPSGSPAVVAHVRSRRRLPRRSQTEDKLRLRSGLRHMGTAAAAAGGDGAADVDAHVAHARGPTRDGAAGGAGGGGGGGAKIRFRTQPQHSVPLTLSERTATATNSGGGGSGRVSRLQGGIATLSLPQAASPASSGRPSGQYEQPASTAVDPKTLILKLLYQPFDKLVVVLKKIDDWQFDAFELERASNGRPLSCLAFHLMKRMELIKKLNLSETRLARFLIRIEEGYGNHPYHSRTHAADVLRSLHIVMTRGGILTAVQRGGPEGTVRNTNKADKAVQARDNSIKLLTVYLAAIIHDYEHRGVNNDFLIRASDELALRYNDISPLENHHVSAAFTLMQQEQYTFLPALGLNKQELRKDVIDLVLATDMKQHFALTGTFRSRIASWHPAASGKSFSAADRSSGAMRRALTHGSHTNLASLALREGSATGVMTGIPAAEVQPWDHETLMLVLKMTLKVADLGHLTSSIDVHKQWVSRLEEELFGQGDRERALGQNVSPLMDRTKTGIQKSQCGFFSVVAQPMFQGFVQAFPQSSALLTNLNANHDYWKEVEALLHKTG